MYSNQTSAVMALFYYQSEPVTVRLSGALFLFTQMNNTYHSTRWKNKRKYILKRDKYLDRDLIRFGRRVEANTVHHIFPKEFYPELEYVDWNLISLSGENHNAMHHRLGHNLSPRGKALQKRFNQKYKRWCKANGVEPHWEN